MDLLLRPEDLFVTLTDTDSNDEVTWVRYEGGNRRHEVKLDDGPSLKTRASHENTAKLGDRVKL